MRRAPDVLTFAVVADAHIVSRDSSQYQYLEVALRHIAQNAYAFVVFAGDMIGRRGSKAVMAELAGVIRGLKQESHVLLGNHELDVTTLREARRLLRPATRGFIHGDWYFVPVIALDRDMSEDAFRHLERALAQEHVRALNKVVLGHTYLDSMDKRTLKRLSLLLTKHKAKGYVCAHRHASSSSRVRIAGVKEIVGGSIDPDKASPGPPGFTVVSCRAGKLSGEHVVVRPSDDRLKAFSDRLGIAPKRGEIEDTVTAARRHGINHIHLCHAGDELQRNRQILRRFARGKGHSLSIHLTEPDFDDDGVMRNRSVILDQMVQAGSAGGVATTIHLPAGEASGLITTRGALRRTKKAHRIFSALSALGRCAASHGLAFTLENRRMRPANRERGIHVLFGCHPDHMTLFMPTADGMTLDVGHAAANMEFTTQFPIQAWFRRFRQHIRLIHAHDIGAMQDGTRATHLVCGSKGTHMVWHGVIAAYMYYGCRAPFLLELPTIPDCVESVLYLRRYYEGMEKHCRTVVY